MIALFANIFGYLLNFIYEVVKNYGVAIIIFSVIIKIILIPISIKQQKTMKKSAKLQSKMKELQFKYKNNPEKLNQEVMELYKKENMSPFSGCFSAIVQLILLLSVFYLVRSPLTYMKKVDSQVITDYTNQIKEQNEGKNVAYPEIQIIEQKGAEDERVNIEMNFLGLDLSKVPTQNMSDYKVFIIPVLYVISSFVSMKITTKTQDSLKLSEDNSAENVEKNEETNEFDAVAQANKNMSLMMPLLSISIALVAPLGLALYWLVNNILMLAERLILNKFMNSKEEDANV